MSISRSQDPVFNTMQRAQAAQRLTSDPLVRALFQEMISSRLDGIAMSEPAQASHRERLYQEIWIIRDFMGTLANLSAEAQRAEFTD